MPLLTAEQMREIRSLLTDMLNKHQSEWEISGMERAIGALALALRHIDAQVALLREARTHIPGTIHTRDVRPCERCSELSCCSTKPVCRKCTLSALAAAIAAHAAGKGEG